MAANVLNLPISERQESKQLIPRQRNPREIGQLVMMHLPDALSCEDCTEPSSEKAIRYDVDYLSFTPEQSTVLFQQTSRLDSPEADMVTHARYAWYLARNRLDNGEKFSSVIADIESYVDSCLALPTHV